MADAHDFFPPVFGGLIFSTVVVFGLRSASLTGMNCPVPESRPILRGFCPDMNILLALKGIGTGLHTPSHPDQISPTMLFHFRTFWLPILPGRL